MATSEVNLHKPVSLVSLQQSFQQKNLWWNVTVVLYRPDALPVTQPSMLKHWPEPVSFFIHCWTPEGKGIISFALAHQHEYPESVTGIWLLKTKRLLLVADTACLWLLNIAGVSDIQPAGQNLARQAILSGPRSLADFVWINGQLPL